ncbi:cyclic amp response element-binding protein a [Anaeramoeba flamelloides]|uniref:Cyclic amp response element-binding protein a n=1 Tax=Anaeramoeba flamelloides TaxID=1746091 RepID=A0ABQ8Z8X9_9EUKA|nr:cyclic amp response element-binding protein a [Anaeramoeba flamelloides]
MDFEGENSTQPLFDFSIFGTDNTSFTPNYLGVETDFDSSFNWDFNPLLHEDKNSQLDNKFENSNQLQNLKEEKKIQQSDLFSSQNLLSHHEAMPLNFPTLSTNSELILDPNQVKDISLLSNTQVPLIEDQFDHNINPKFEHETPFDLKSNPQETTPSNNKQERKRTKQMKDLPQPKAKAKSKPKPKVTVKVKAKTAPQIEKTAPQIAITGTKTNTKQDISPNVNEQPNTENKKRTKKVDWLNLGVKLSEKEKTLLTRLSGKRNRDLSQSDRLEWKRLRDRISARHSRQKKKAYLTNLETKVNKLQNEKSQTDKKLSNLENENHQLRNEINKLKEIIKIKLMNSLQPEQSQSLKSNNECLDSHFLINNNANEKNNKTELDLLY